METKAIGILGCGWLGKALAKKLITKNHSVKGSARTKESIKDLEDLGIQPYKINIGINTSHRETENFLKDIDVLIITIPPKFKKGEEHLFIGLERFFSAFDFSNVKKLVYISSTGVFQDSDNNKIYTEDSFPNNTSERGKYLIKLENLILDQVDISNKSIVRLGGLIKHQGRHPITHLAGRENVPNPDAAVNLIEQTDAVNLLIKVIESDSPLKIFHGVSPKHTSRKEYYTQKALELNLNPPIFIEGETSIGKIISSEITSRTLNFEYTSGI